MTPVANDSWPHPEPQKTCFFRACLKGHRSQPIFQFLSGLKSVDPVCLALNPPKEVLFNQNEGHLAFGFDAGELVLDRRQEGNTVTV